MDATVFLSRAECPSFQTSLLRVENNESSFRSNFFTPVCERWHLCNQWYSKNRLQSVGACREIGISAIWCSSNRLKIGNKMNKHFVFLLQDDLRDWFVATCLKLGWSYTICLKIFSFYNVNFKTWEVGMNLSFIILLLASLNHNFIISAIIKISSKYLNAVFEYKTK